jgi:hypothetical protein
MYWIRQRCQVATTKVELMASTRPGIGDHQRSRPGLGTLPPVPRLHRRSPHDRLHDEPHQVDDSNNSATSPRTGAFPNDDAPSSCYSFSTATPPSQPAAPPAPARTAGPRPSTTRRCNSPAAYQWSSQLPTGTRLHRGLDRPAPVIAALCHTCAPTSAAAAAHRRPRVTGSICGTCETASSLPSPHETRGRDRVGSDLTSGSRILASRSASRHLSLDGLREVVRQAYQAWARNRSESRRSVLCARDPRLDIGGDSATNRSDAGRSEDTYSTLEKAALVSANWRSAGGNIEPVSTLGCPPRGEATATKRDRLLLYRLRAGMGLVPSTFSTS